MSSFRLPEHNGHKDVLMNRVNLALDSQVEKNGQCLNIQSMSSCGLLGLQKAGGRLITQGTSSQWIPGWYRLVTG